MQCFTIISVFPIATPSHFQTTEKKRFRWRDSFLNNLGFFLKQRSGIFSLTNSFWRDIERLPCIFKYSTRPLAQKQSSDEPTSASVFTPRSRNGERRVIIDIAHRSSFFFPVSLRILLNTERVNPEISVLQVSSNKNIVLKCFWQALQVYFRQHRVQVEPC